MIYFVPVPPVIHTNVIADNTVRVKLPSTDSNKNDKE